MPPPGGLLHALPLSSWRGVLRTYRRGRVGQIKRWCGIFWLWATPGEVGRMDLSRDQVREVDRRAIDEFGVPGVVLMENAGRGTAELLRALGVHGRVAVCCGKGNNGGDGFVIARHLDNAGVPVRVLLFARPEELTGD